MQEVSDEQHLCSRYPAKCREYGGDQKPTDSLTACEQTGHQPPLSVETIMVQKGQMLCGSPQVAPHEKTLPKHPSPLVAKLASD